MTKIQGFVYFLVNFNKNGKMNVRGRWIIRTVLFDNNTPIFEPN